MFIYPEIEAFKDTLTDWRRDIHRHPEIAFEEHRTAEFVANKMEEWGIEVHRGVGRTGVVGKLTSGGGNRAIGLRADLDALPMQELNEFEHKSIYDGKFHGCGHDGHTVMLLGAAKHLSETKNFDGTVYFIFQPAEEDAGGGRVMVEDGLFTRFPMDAVYGLHNWPGNPIGTFAVKSGTFFAAYASFDIELTGIGGHAAMPHNCKDPIVAASEIVQSLQTIVSRTIVPTHPAVVSVTQIHGGSAYNVIPDTVTIAGCTRYFSASDNKKIENRIRSIAEGIAQSHGIKAEVTYTEKYPVLTNTREETDQCISVAGELVGAENVEGQSELVMGSEDFAFMLQEKPGCYILMGNGDGEGGCMVHHPKYDFNDKALPLGASYWTKLAETLLPVG